MKALLAFVKTTIAGGFLVILPVGSIMNWGIGSAELTRGRPDLPM